VFASRKVSRSLQSASKAIGINEVGEIAAQLRVAEQNLDLMQRINEPFPQTPFFVARQLRQNEQKLGCFHKATNLARSGVFQ